MSTRCYKSSPNYGFAKLKVGKPLNVACSKSQPDIMTFVDLVRGVTEKFINPSRKQNLQCTRLNGKPNQKRAKHAISTATKPMLTSNLPNGIISKQDKKINQTAVEIIEHNNAKIAQKSPSSSPKKNYFCFASEYLAELEEAEAMEKQTLSNPVDVKTDEMADRTAEIHHSLGRPLSVVVEEEEYVLSAKSRFKIPSRVKIPQRASSQKCNLTQNQSQKMPGQKTRRPWQPRLEKITESVEVTC